MAKQYINQDTPVYISYSRADYDAAQKLCALLREKYINIVDGEADIKNGFVNVLPPKKPAKGQEGCTYVKVHFGCDYGMVINKRINWYK